jgi:hypothetical protein
VVSLVHFFLESADLTEQHSLQIHWDQMPLHLQNGPIAFYNITYTRAAKSFITFGEDSDPTDDFKTDEFIARHTVQVPEETKFILYTPVDGLDLYTFTIPELTSFSSYTFVIRPSTSPVQSSTKDALGPMASITIPTRISAPRQPPPLRIEKRLKHGAVVSWRTLSNETGEPTKVWIMIEPYDPNPVTDRFRLLEIVKLVPGAPKLAPLPAPFVQVDNAKFVPYSPDNITDICARELFGYTFRDRITGKVCGGFCPRQCALGTEMLDLNQILAPNDEKNYQQQFPHGV